jgi:hypothetical protein
MSIKTTPMEIKTAKRRVIHVPLTDTEWRDVRVAAAMSETTIGVLTARALLAASNRGENTK